MYVIAAEIRAYGILLSSSSDNAFHNALYLGNGRVAKTLNLGEPRNLRGKVPACLSQRKRRGIQVHIIFQLLY